MKKSIIILAALIMVGCSTASDHSYSAKDAIIDVVSMVPCALDPTGVACDGALMAADIAKE